MRTRVLDMMDRGEIADSHHRVTLAFQQWCAKPAPRFAWEHIVDHVPGFKTAYGAEAAEKLFESMSVFGSSFAERYVSCR